MEENKIILTALSVIFKGDWNKIYDEIANKRLDYNISDFKRLIQKEIVDKGYNFITMFDPEYPAQLNQTPNPPFVLFYKGNIDLLKKPKIAVLGKRNCSISATEKIHEISEKIFENKYGIIVTGMAIGVQRAALESYHPAIVVLGCGINCIYPKENEDIYHNLEQNGLIISEYPDDVQPSADNIVRRQRIIIGLCDVVVVGESSERSGTQLCATLAVAQLKDLLCIPNSSDQNDFANMLIAEGAEALVRDEQIPAAIERRKHKS